MIKVLLYCRRRFQNSWPKARKCRWHRCQAATSTEQAPSRTKQPDDNSSSLMIPHRINVHMDIVDMQDSSHRSATSIRWSLRNRLILHLWLGLPLPLLLRHRFVSRGTFHFFGWLCVVCRWIVNGLGELQPCFGLFDTERVRALRSFSPLWRRNGVRSLQRS
jgi:hypothetical protein